MASVITKTQSNRAYLCCGAIGDLHYESAAPVWCFPALCSLYTTNLGISGAKRRSNLVLGKCTYKVAAECNLTTFRIFL